MNNQTVSFTKAQKTVLNSAQEILDGYCADKASIVDIWIGAKDITNPTTGEVIGTKQTANLDLYVNEDDFSEISNAMSFLGGSGQYLKGEFAGRELIAIKPRTKLVKVGDKQETRYIVQFTKQNVSKVTTIEEAEARMSAFDEELPTMKAEPVTSKKPAF